MMWRILVGLGVALAAAWGALVLLLVFSQPRNADLSETLKLLPHMLRLLGRLAADTSLPLGIRIRLWLVLAYLASPIDLVPDFLPVVGYADDAILVCAVIRSVVRKVGADGVRGRWSGSEAGLAALLRMAGLPFE